MTVTRGAPVEVHSPILGKRAGRKYGGGASWLVTFVDLISLMLAFFVLRFSMTTLETPRYDAAASSISITLGREVSIVEQGPPVIDGVESETNGRGFQLGYLEPVLRAKLERDPVLRTARLERRGDELVIALPSDLLFELGRATLIPDAETAVRELATALATLPNKVDVVGHADPQPITGANAPYPNNWGLSLARADAVARGLVRGGYPHVPVVEGQGDSRFAETGLTRPLAERYALARRVDVVIHPERVAGPLP
jgi:chemotaxis protein MotB